MTTDLIGKTFLVTGATSGIGLATAEQLAQRGATVIGVGRSAERCAAAEARLRSSGGQVRYLVADLSLQSEVRRLAAEVRSQVLNLDGLVNNAGTFTWQRIETAEGFEMQWAVNHLAPFALTLFLLPLLQAAPTARVVTVSSGSHYHTRLSWKDLQLRRGYNGLLAYKQTKLCNVLFTAELNRRLGPDSTVRAFAADPGLVFTDMGFKGTPWLVRMVWNWRRRGGIPPEESARGVVFLATEPSIQQATDIYWKHGVVKSPNPYALDPDAARRLWEISARMCGLDL
jgi:NAD(P)-dependent dehydrogenase (short-subunit alcohol dehydrogenase family)